jgi:hypothetical protein
MLGMAVTVGSGAGLYLGASQRCGGSLDYLIRDERGAIISASQIKVTVLPVAGEEDSSFGMTPYRSARGYTYYHRSPEDRTRNDIGPEPESLTFPTNCSRPLIDVKLEYRNMLMILHFKQVPDELNFFVDSMPFQEGEFEIKLRPKSELYQFSDSQQMSAEEKSENIYLKELIKSPVVAAKEWGRMR